METVARVHWIAEADAMRMLLESSGIETHLPDEGMTLANPLFANALGGIRVQVAESDLERAREILADRPEEETGSMFRCPSCGSDSVDWRRGSAWTGLLTLLLFGLPLPWLRGRCRCDDCGHEWRESIEEDGADLAA